MTSIKSLIFPLFIPVMICSVSCSFKYKKDELNAEKFPSLIKAPKNHRHSPTNQSNSSIDICNVCWCNKKDRKDVLTCRKDNTLTQFPVITDPTHRTRIREITLENQWKLSKLSTKELSLYPELIHLTITNSGLIMLEADAFRGNSKLAEIDLRDNLIRVLPWDLFQKLPLSILTITGNPLACNCSNKWIQIAMAESNQNLGPYWDKISCRTNSGVIKNLLQVEILGCDLPSVTIHPKKIVINESQSLSLTCNITGHPFPRISWVIDDSFSRLAESFNLSNFENSQFENSSVIIDPASGQLLIALQSPNRSNTLTIENITNPDVGTIKCVAENVVGIVKDEATIIIQGKPRIEYLEPKRMFHLCISYRVTGVPDLTRNWYFNNEPLETSDNIKDLETARSLKDPHLMEGCLQIERAVQKIIGNYTLVATNSCGQTKQTIIIDHQTAGLPSLPYERLRPPVNLAQNHGNRVSASRSYQFSHSDGLSFRTILVLIGLFGAILIVSSILIFFIIHNYNSRAQTKIENGLVVREKIPLKPSKIVQNVNYSPSHELISESGLKLIEKSRIKFIRELGEGAFGRVFLGKVENLHTSDDEKLVAIKTLKDSSEFRLREDFEREAEVLNSLNHKNIVQFFGISVDGETLMMIIEYMKYGDLNNYLRIRDPKAQLIRTADECYVDNDDLNLDCFLRIALQIANGLEYLSFQHFVHRDLATRNCLVGDDLLVKICDFGMSRDLYETDYYKIGHQAKLPIRWMSPESIMYRKFTTHSDIWSFGIVLWEIFTYGKQPFYQLSNQEAIKEIVEGRVLDQPELCPKSLYDLMLSCWNLNPVRRITASKIVEKLKEVQSEINQDPKLISESSDIIR